MKNKSIKMSEYATDHKIPVILFREESGSEGNSFMTKQLEQAVKVANACGVSSLILEDEQWACDPQTHKIYLQRVTN